MDNIKINLRGDEREFARGISGYEVAQSIGAGLAKAACAVAINGETADLRTPIEQDCALCSPPAPPLTTASTMISIAT